MVTNTMPYPQALNIISKCNRERVDKPSFGFHYGN
jgi:hypothetical protein